MVTQQTTWKKIVACAALLLPLIVQAQSENVALFGRVLDSLSHQGVPFASVFIDRSSIGTIADANGNFKFSVPPSSQVLGVSAVGYTMKSTILHLGTGKSKLIVVQLKTTVLREVVVTARRDPRRAGYLEQFRKEVIGATANADQTKIVNPDALDFETKNGRLYVTAREALIIDNDALGYRINLFLMDCILSRSTYEVKFIANFQPKNAATVFQYARWQTNRTVTFQGSEIQFVRALADNKLENDGYVVYAIRAFKNGPAVSYFRDPTPLPWEKIVHSDSVAGTYIRGGRYEIHYTRKYEEVKHRTRHDITYPVSELVMLDTAVYIHRDGMIIQPAHYYRISGTYMDRMRLADLLPLDYQETPGTANVSENSFNGSITGVVLNTQRRPLQGATVFINQSTLQTKTDHTGKFTLSGLPAGTYDVAAYDELEKTNSVVVAVVPSETASVEIVLTPAERKTWGPLDTDLKKNYAFLFASQFHPYLLQNREVLEFKLENKNIVARASAPLVLIDKKLGYKVTYFLDTLQVRTGHWKEDFPHTGYVVFDTLRAQSGDAEQWQQSRLAQYKGSVAHLIHALTEGRSVEEGFRMYTLPGVTPENSITTGNQKAIRKYTDAFRKTITERVKANAENDLWVSPDHNFVLNRDHRSFDFTLPPMTGVAYFPADRTSKDIGDAQWSWLQEQHTPVKIARAGWLTDPREISVAGAMSDYKVIPPVPLDYTPPVIKNDPSFVKPAVFRQDVTTFLEKPVVQTNKDYYYPGERLWFSAWMTYSKPEFKDLLSAVLYVELTGPKNAVVLSRTYAMDRSTTAGDFQLPDTLKSGQYHLRAYTAWSSNFGGDYIFSKAIPVLTPRQNIDQKRIEEFPETEGDLSVSTTLTKGAYTIRDRVDAQVSLKTLMGRQAAGTFSVSVTDSARVADLRSDYGQWNKHNFEKPDSAAVRLVNTVEKEITYSGVISNTGKPAPTSVYFINTKDNRSRMLNVNDGVHFDFSVNHYDTNLFYFGIPKKLNPYLQPKIAIARTLAVPPIRFTDLTLSVPLKEENMMSAIRSAGFDSTHAVFLDEVVVRRDRDLRPSWIRKLRPPTMSYNAPSQLQVLQQSSYLLDGLARIIPGLQVRERNGGTSHTLSIPTAMYGVQLYVNGYGAYNLYTPDQANMIVPPNEVVGVEWRKQYNGMEDALFVFTRQVGFKPQANYEKVVLRGLSKPATFWAPDYSKTSPTDPDERTTIYWNPNLTVTENTPARFSFYTADIPTTYRITIAGVSATGETFRVERYVKVKVIQ